MIKKIFIWTHFANILCANTILENSTFTKIYLEKDTKIYVDESSSLSFEEIKNKEFKHSLKSNFTATKSAIWSYFSITLLEDSEAFFENIKAGIDFIDVYIVKDGNLFEKIELGDYRDIKNRDLKTKNSAFLLKMEANTTYEFYIKYNSYSSISTIWEVYNKSSYEELLSFRTLVWGIFIGTIFILTFHNLFIYFSTKEKAFLFYVVFIVSSALYQLLVNGILYEYFKNIDLNILSSLNWIFAFSTLLATLLFHFFVLKPKKGTLNFRLIIISICLTSLVLVYYMFCFKYPQIRYSVNYTNLVSFFAMCTLLLTSFLAYKDGEKYAKIYFFVLSFYVLLSFYIVSILVGFCDYFENFWLFVPIATLIDVSLFTIILYSKLKDIERQRREQEQFIISQARFTSLGNNVANMIHQWKTPIAQIGSQVTLLETAYHFDNKNYMQISKDVIPHIKESILFLKDTMNDIYNFYKNPLEKELFLVKDQINTLLSILKSELQLNEIRVNSDIEDIEIYGYKTSFLNIIMILLENSIFQLKNFKKEDRRIVIVAEKLSAERVRIIVEDNGGGIQNEYLGFIFDLSFSTKNKSGSGIGLALAKTLVEKRLNGKIEVKNISNGASFTILLNI